MITSWLKTLLKKNPSIAIEDKPSNREETEKRRYFVDFYDNYFSLIAAGARLKLVEAMFNLNLFALFEEENTRLEQDIINQLGLMPIRARKWLHLLACEHFLIKTQINNQPAYSLSEQFVEIIKSDKWWGMQFFFNSWSYAAEENLSDVLSFGRIKTSVSWPPKKDSEVLWLENWMTNTTEPPLRCLLEHINFNIPKTFLDVGGGDGTIACALIKAHPHLKATVYNLPKSAELARKKIASQGLAEQVSVYEGDFIKETRFPAGHDLILFIRVLFDWNEEVARKLLKMAYEALPKNGLVGICEFYKEENNNQCLASEYRYIFHDDFTPHVMKTAAEYRAMLKDCGFKLIPTNTEIKTKRNIFSLLLGQK